MPKWAANDQPHIRPGLGSAGVSGAFLVQVFSRAVFPTSPVWSRGWEVRGAPLALVLETGRRLLPHTPQWGHGGLRARLIKWAAAPHVSFSALTHGSCTDSQSGTWSGAPRWAWSPLPPACKGWQRSPGGGLQAAAERGPESY